MTASFIIEVDEAVDGIIAVWSLTEGGAQPSSLDVLKTAPQPAETIAILDGRAVVSHSVQLPDVDDNKARKIIPAVVDDKVAMSDARDHTALLSARNNEDGSRLIGIVAVEAMTKLRSLALDAGASLVAAVPDYLLLSTSEDGPISLTHEDKSMCRLPDGGGYTLDADAADWMPATSQLDRPWTELLRGAVDIEANLLQGAFVPRTDLRTTFLWWRRAAILAAVVVLTAGLNTWFAASENYERAETLYAAAEQTFREVLPDEPRIINMDAQLRRAIAARGQTGGGEFFELSSLIIEAVEGSEQTVLETLRYDQSNGELALDVSFASFAESSNFKRALEQNNVAVTEGSSRQEGGRVLSEIRVRRP